MDAGSRVDRKELKASSLKDSFSQLLRDAERRHEDGAAVARGQRLKALSYATNDVVAWRLDLNGDSFSVACDGHTLDHRVAHVGGLH